MISIIQEGVLLEFICPGLPGSAEGPKRETTPLQKQLRMIKKRKLLIFEKHQRKETFLSEKPLLGVAFPTNATPK